MVLYKFYLDSRTGHQIFIHHLAKESPQFSFLVKITLLDREAIKSIPHLHIRAIMILWLRIIKALKAINEEAQQQLLILISLNNLHSIIISLTSHPQ